jgi:hypothetical protein
MDNSVCLFCGSYLFIIHTIQIIQGLIYFSQYQVAKLILNLTNSSFLIIII